VVLTQGNVLFMNETLVFPESSTPSKPVGAITFDPVLSAITLAIELDQFPLLHHMIVILFCAEHIG
jgi:hypothetical protein